MKLKLSVGEYLKSAFMEPIGLTNQRLSVALDVTPATISRLVSGKSELSIDMANRLSKAFGNSVSQWLTIQSDWQVENIFVDVSMVEVLSKKG